MSISLLPVQPEFWHPYACILYASAEIVIVLLDIVMSFNKGAKIRFLLSAINLIYPNAWGVERKLCLKDRLLNVTLNLLKEKGCLNLHNNSF